MGPLKLHVLHDPHFVVEILLYPTFHHFMPIKDWLTFFVNTFFQNCIFCKINGFRLILDLTLWVIPSAFFVFLKNFYRFFTLSCHFVRLKSWFDGKSDHFFGQEWVKMVRFLEKLQGYKTFWHLFEWPPCYCLFMFKKGGPKHDSFFWHKPISLPITYIL